MSNFANIPLNFSAMCSLVSLVFIKIHEYSNNFVYISSHKVRALYCSIFDIKFATLGQISMGIITYDTICRDNPKSAYAISSFPPTGYQHVVMIT